MIISSIHSLVRRLIYESFHIYIFIRYLAWLARNIGVRSTLNTESGSTPESAGFYPFDHLPWARVFGDKVFLRHLDVVSTNTFSTFVHIAFAYKCNIVFQDKAI